VLGLILPIEFIAPDLVGSGEDALIGGSRNWRGTKDNCMLLCENDYRAI
jgi:hypothetical protein